MNQANQEENKQAPQIDRHETAAPRLGALDLERESETEEEREDGVELAVGEELNPPDGEAIGKRRQVAMSQSELLYRVAEELQVDEQNAEQSEPTQDVNELNAFVWRHRTRLNDCRGVFRTCLRKDWRRPTFCQANAGANAKFRYSTHPCLPCTCPPLG